MPIQQRFISFAIFALALVTTVAGPAWTAEPQPTPEARVHFKAGVEHLVAKRYEDAHRELQTAYGITPTWKILGNLGIAADHLERDGEAIDAFEEYTKRGGKSVDPEEAREVRNDLERLRAGIATVTLDAAGARSFWVIDDRTDAPTKITNRYGPFDGVTHLRVRAGRHEFSVEGASAARWLVSLLPGELAAHSFAAHPDPSTEVVTEFESAPVETPPDAVAEPSSHTASYWLWAGGGVGAVASTVFFIEANRIQSDGDIAFARRCPLGALDTPGCEETTADSRRAANWRTASLVTGVAAIGALATGTVLYFMDTSTPNQESADASLWPWISLTGVGASGRF